MFRTLTAAAILALITPLAFTAAQAETPVSIGVAYGDLNLSSPQDAAILADRLQVAARDVCLNATDTKAPIRKILVRRCIDLAVNKATAQIWDNVEASPNRAVRANLVSVRQKVASIDVP
jgi:UrcA family protein